ncbi:MAG: hypothetical protein J5880_02030, partial [Bacilli bacterium]|nr:hypothetical protein [Bacilli bacterium]
MMKIKYLGALILALALTGCSGGEQAVANTAPSVVGVKDVQCIVNTTVDFLDGVAALDKEDGDITPKLDITITPHVDIKDGYATFTKTGEYVVSYTISDSHKRTSQKKSYVDVVARDKYATFDMPQGFYGETNGKAVFSTCGMVNGEFHVKATGQEVAEDVKISRKFSLNTNLLYTFNYEINSHSAGKVTALAEDQLIGEMNLKEGYNKLSFKHIVLGEEDTKEDVMISLCFGAIPEKVELTISGLSTEYPQEAGKVVDLTPDFSFSGRVERRFDEAKGVDGNAWFEPDGKTAVLEITKACDDYWPAGMFVNTGVTLKEDTNYNFYVDIEAVNECKFNVIFQKNQWDETRIEGVYNEVATNGLHMRSAYITSEKAGPLWLYVEGGVATNNIKIKNFKVEEILNATGKDSYVIEDYHEYHNSAYECEFASNLGSFKYTIDKFAENDGDEKVQSAAFFVSGSGSNYVLSFKAKATSPIEVVVAAPVAGGWDPTLMWSKITLNEQETVYTFFFNGSGSDRDYTVVWQFGSKNNQQYEDVEIEVSDVQITLRNR